VLASERAAPSTRVFALTTGTLGLLAVGVLILTITPHRQDAPIAISATTSPVELDAAPAGTDDSTEAAAVRGLSPVPLTLAPELQSATAAVATPVGDGRLAIVTQVAMTDASDDDPRFVTPSGRIVSGRIVDQLGDAVLVSLDEPEPGPSIARERPDGDDIVTVLSDPPVTVAFADVSALDEVVEGTAVVDGSGELVGLCSRDGDGAGRVIEVSEDVAVATNDGP
jgi:hypothetical protein